MSVRRTEAAYNVVGDRQTRDPELYWDQWSKAARVDDDLKSGKSDLKRYTGVAWAEFAHDCCCTEALTDCANMTCEPCDSGSEVSTCCRPGVEGKVRIQCQGRVGGREAESGNPFEEEAVGVEGMASDCFLPPNSETTLSAPGPM